MQTALKSAKAVLANEKATQAGVDAAVAALRNAIKALAPPTGDNADTGDGMLLGLLMAVMVLSLGGVAVLPILRKKNII